MIPINMQCWLNVGWGLTEFIIRIQGKWGSWVRSRCCLSQELKRTGVWETSHSLQWSQEPHLWVPLRIAAFPQFPHWAPLITFFYSTIIIMQNYLGKDVTLAPSTFFCFSVYEVGKKIVIVFLAYERKYKINKKLAIRNQWEV